MMMAFAEDFDDTDLTHVRQKISKARDERDADALQIVLDFLEKTGNGPERVSGDVYVSCAEAALQEDFEKAVDYFLKAIEVAKLKPRNHCLVFNASVLYLRAVRPLLQRGRSFSLAPSLRQVLRSLEEVNDEDRGWRARLMMQLIECHVDGGNAQEATSLAKVTEEFVRSHTPHLFPELFSLLIQHELSDCDVLLAMSRQNPTLTAIYKLEEVKKSGSVDGDEPKEADAAKLQDIFRLFVTTKESPTESNPQPLPPAARVAFLLELALLALQSKHLKVAADCLKALKSAEEASPGQRIVAECIGCEIGLLKKEARKSEYSKGGVEARLREIGKLDEWLLNAARAGDPRATQAVCASLWRLCLPLLQHNLRGSLRNALLRVARALEDTQSLLLETRRQVHSELALIEEDEGRPEAALTHLRKAQQLDADGTHGGRASAAASRLLRLRAPRRSLPRRTEDEAAALMQQVKEMPRDSDSRPVLAAVGLLLAPDDFQVVLDADDPSKVASGTVGSGRVAELCVKAQHHSSSVQTINKHLDRQDDSDPTERLRLWAALAKASRKREEWDVCRAACRFCLLYDDGGKEGRKGRKPSKEDSEKTKHPEAEDCASKRGSPVESTEECDRESLLLLAQIHFINAEAVVQKLHTEGLQLNGQPAPPQGVSQDDADWTVYRDWIISLSAHASFSFVRAAELGAEISESWVVANAAVYLWNYNQRSLSQRRYQLLLPTFRPVVDLMQKMQYTGDRALLALLCNAVARGLLQPLPAAVAVETPVPVDKGRGRRGAASVSGPALDPAALQDARKALELCDFALKLSSSSVSDVPIAVRGLVVSTWVQTKRLLQQQISPALEPGDESPDAEVSAMTRVLVGLEMLECSRSPGQMDFPLPALSTLVSLASECSWPDAVVELQVWCQLSTFCHDADDHSLVLSCSHRALGLKEAAAQRLSSAPYALYSGGAVNEMLSRASCLRALSLAHESRGDLSRYRAALDLLLSSVRYADQAGSWSLCAAAAGHYCNTCLPLAGTPGERARLRDPLEIIQKALLHTLSQRTKQNKKTLAETLDDGVPLRAAVYRLLLQIHMDGSDLKSAKRLLEKAQLDLPRGEHKLSLLKSLICVKARLGDNVATEMRKLEGEGEQCCSDMWHRVALCSQDLTQRLSCYQRAIDTLTRAESQWQKVSLLLELSEWLFFNNFPKADALQMVEWATDVLVQLHPENALLPDDASTNGGSSEEPAPSELTDVKCLDALVRAHTLLATMTGRTAPDHRPNVLRAHRFVLQMWKVSMTEAGHISSMMIKFQAQSASPASAGSKRGKEKDKGKVKKPKEISLDEDKPKPLLSDLSPPLTLRDWVCFHCPDQARRVFRTNSSSRCLNARSVSEQPRSLFYLDLLEKQLQSLSLAHLALPVLHLAEVIAHDLLDRKDLAQLYRLRIVKSCCELRVETHSPYHEKLHSLVRIHQRELIGCKRDILIYKEKKSLDRTHKQGQSDALWEDECAQRVWLDKADACLSLGLHAQAKHLLEEARSAATEFADHISAGRSLLRLAALACEQQNHAQALILLDEAQASGGDQDHWYQLTLTRVQATAGLRGEHGRAEIDDAVKRGCEALQHVQEKQVNRSEEVEFMITSLKMRGAVESIALVSEAEPGQTLLPEVFLRLKSDCDKLKECERHFTLLQHPEQAAEALAHCAHTLRFSARHAAETEEKQRLLLDALSQMQAAVRELEDVALEVQSLLPAQEESPVVTPAVLVRLLRLRLALSELCLLVLEERCAERRRQASARNNKSAAEVLLEDFTRGTPEPHTVQEAWLKAGATLGQVALGQLAAINNARHPSSAETRARGLCLLGKYLRLQATVEDPAHAPALWDPQQQLNSQRAVDLLAEASKSLSEASSLCLQNQLCPALLSEVCLNMVETHGLTDPSVTGQYLALLQTCQSVGLMSKVLTAARSDSRDPPLSGDEGPAGPLQAARATVRSGSKFPVPAFTHLSVNPSHLTFLSELPPNVKLLLLQHSEDRKELYGAFYEVKSQGNQKGKTTHTKGPTCAKVAKVPVRPETLLTLLERVRTLGRETRWVRLEEARRRTAEGGTDASPESSAAERELASLFGELLRQMEAYLDPLLSQFDFSGFRPVAAAPEPPRPKDKEEKTSSAAFPGESGESLVLLADQTLLLFPLEALPALQEDGLTSVSRDFSLQLLHRRLQESQKVEGDNKKETKGAKAKGDQSQVIKARPLVPPPNTVPVNAKSIKYVVDPFNDGVFGGTSLSTRMREILETHGQLSAHLWEGFMGGTRRPSVAEMEQLLSRCSAFIFLGMERFMGNVTPARISALDLSECHMALLFDLVQNQKSIARQSDLDKDKSPGHLALETPLHTALLLSVGGVRCITLNQWHSSFHRNTKNMAAVLDGLLKEKQTSGQVIHSLTKSSRTPRSAKEKMITSHDHKPNMTPADYTCVLYGLPNLIVQ